VILGIFEAFRWMALADVSAWIWEESSILDSHGNPALTSNKQFFALTWLACLDRFLS